MNIHLLRTDSDHPDFLTLMRDLDAELAILDGEDHAFYAQYNKTYNIRCVLVAYLDNRPVGIGAIRPYGSDTMEVKRMYVVPDSRQKGIARRVLAALEDWAREQSYARCVLETGKRQPEAIALYQKSGYRVTPNYGQYEGMDNSVCFEKVL